MNSNHIVVLICIAIIAAILLGCNNYDNGRKQALAIQEQQLQKYFIIEQQSTNATLTSVFVYVPDTSKLRAVNNYLKERYGDFKSKLLQITYYDKKNLMDSIDKIRDTANTAQLLTHFSRYIVADYLKKTGEEGRLLFMYKPK